MVVKIKFKYVKSKKRNQAAKKTQKKSKKVGKVMKSNKSMKSKKNVKSKKGINTSNHKTMKNRIHLKHIPKRKLSQTLKKARKKIQKQLKKLYLKGGSKGGGVLEGMELPQHAVQTGASMNALGNAMIVGGQADALNVVNPQVLE